MKSGEALPPIGSSHAAQNGENGDNYDEDGEGRQVAADCAASEDANGNPKSPQPLTLLVKDQASAISALDAIYASLTANLPEATVDVILEAMMQRTRNMLYEVRGTGPEATTAFDDQVEQVLSYMVSCAFVFSQKQKKNDIYVCVCV